MENNTVVILYNKVAKDAKYDELDILEQVEIVKTSLLKLNYTVEEVTIDLKLKKAIKKIQKINPKFIFNLAETLENKGEFAYIPTSILNFLKIPYTGVPLIPMFITTNKFLTKTMLRKNNIPTADFFSLQEINLLKNDEKYILKPIWEDGSLGLDEDCVFMGNNDAFKEKIKTLRKEDYFIEKFVDGREFNISVVCGNPEPEVLPHAEMTFIDFPEDKPKIMGYTAKWDENSFEYLNTARTFEQKPEDKELHNRIDEICKQCWNTFGLKGYVRVDFRVDADNIPYVLEINSNPCISENGGFYAASLQAGYEFHNVIERIIKDAFI